MSRLIKDIPADSAVDPNKVFVVVDPVTGEGKLLTLAQIIAASGTSGSDASDLTRAAITARKRFSGQAAAGSEFENIFADLHGSVTGAHTFEIKSGIPNRFASQADHSHLKLHVTNPAGPAPGSAAYRAQLLYSGFTDGTSSLNLHGYGPEIGMAVVANEDSLDTTGTNATLTGAPNYQGIIKIRYDVAPSLTLNQLVIFNVSSAVAGIQASLYGGKVTQLPTLVSGKYEILVQISGLDTNHWSAANAKNESALDNNWDLRTLTQPEIASGNKVSIARDTTGPTDQLTITWGAAHNLTLGQSISVWADIGISGITGLTTGNFNSGHVVEVVSSTVAKVRVRNSRIHTLRSFSGTNSTTSQWAVYSGTRDPHHEPLPPHNSLAAWRDVGGRTRRMSLGGSDVLPTADLSASFGFDLPPVTRPKTIRIGVFDQYLDVLDGMASRSIASLITAQTNGLAFDGTSPASVRSTLTGHPIGTGDLTIWERIRVPNSPPPSGQFNFVIFIEEAGGHRVGCYIASGTGALTTTIDNGSTVNVDFISIPDFVTNYAGQVVDIHLVRKGTVIETYLNGTLYNSTTNAKAAANFTEAAVLRAGGLSAETAFLGRVHKMVLFNRAYTGREIQEMIDFDVNVDDRQGSPNNLVTNTGFETDTSGYFVFQAGVASLTRITSDSNSGSACAEFSGTAGGDYFRTDVGSSPKGVRYRVTFWAKLISGNPIIIVGRNTGNSVNVTLTGSWTKYVIETDKFVGALTNYVQWQLTGATIFRIDDISVEQLGTVIDLDCGVGAGSIIPDRSQNKLHAIASASVRHLIPTRRGQVRVKITGTGQTLSGATVIPANSRISSIVAKVVGSGTLSLGSSSGGTQFVNAASVVAGLNDLTVGTRLNATAAALWATVAGITSAEIILSYEMVDL